MIKSFLSVLFPSFGDTETPETPEIRKGHIPPDYWGYQGGYDAVTVCNNCQRTALYKDQHPSGPCPECGSEVSDGLFTEPDFKRSRYSAKWGGAQWVFSKYSSKIKARHYPSKTVSAKGK